ncbi:DUF1816 domain-containing protein [Leptothoe sp. PORK10 BA2]|uniref:DUF1816 domain-containing protein n=1 Tax=Leptothoe sp. PORK10 BA2 TaxID=3110254 RepID=UPI002B1EECA0|nr:DUF1816 domain-containing protein [Leptothoe sp. PORK10 BA2]MEA5465818.1 DUF1816 domain-containing protein [Leptothoe sp. PORK10 BA2]
MKNFTNQLFGLFQKSWWLEISTVSPSCEYYFGPFGSENEALQEQPGYMEDIEQEGSKVQKVLVTHRKTPAQLTVEYPQAS